jgi:thioredoxin reductase (NADPH)
VDETPDIYGAYPRLSDEQVALLAERGERRSTKHGDVLFRDGDAPAEFYVIVDGTVALVDGYDPETGEGDVLSVHGHHRFLGELSLLTGEAEFVTAVVQHPGEVVVVPVDRLRELIVEDAAIGDLILRAYLIRRSLLMEAGAGMRIIGSRYSEDTRRLREFAARNRVPHKWIDLDADAAVDQLLRRLGITPDQTPIVICPGNQVLRNPSNAEVARAIGLPSRAPTPDMRDLIVLGAGPAGLAAAVYGAADGLDTLVFDAVATGGQAATSPRIENYLGFPAGVSGGELADRAFIQAEKFGAEFSVPYAAARLRRCDGHFAVEMDDGTLVPTRTVLIATGARYRKLDVPRLHELEPTSIFYAATPVEAKACSGTPVSVVGGGNSAGQASVFLSKQVARVRLVVRGEYLAENMSRYLADRIERTPNVDVLLHTEVRELIGDRALEAIVVEDTHTGERRQLDSRYLFVFIGAEPHTSWLDEQLALDGRGFIVAGAAASSDLPLETSWPGVFAAGDVRSGSVKRVASAVGEGAMAVAMVHEHLTREH